MVFVKKHPKLIAILAALLLVASAASFGMLRMRLTSTDPILEIWSDSFTACHSRRDPRALLRKIAISRTSPGQSRNQNQSNQRTLSRRHQSVPCCEPPQFTIIRRDSQFLAPDLPVAHRGSDRPFDFNLTCANPSNDQHNAQYFGMWIS